MNIFAELKRRHMYRVAAAYAVVAWVLIQLVNNIAQPLRLPEWTPALVIVLLLIGLPIALLMTWMRDLAPAEGGRTSTGKLDWILIGALVVVIALVSYQQLAPTRIAQEPKPLPIDSGTAILLAVLPFSNLSSDPEQEFFSDGMTEEITTALAKVPDLRVIARTSAFEFKGQNLNIQSIGQQLHATHLIEGSVRKASDRVRIAVQLIKADDGTHVWAENYDRELTDVFAVQEEIARAITASLRMPLGLKPGENLVNNRKIDPDSYQQFLRAKAFWHARNNTNGGRANLSNAIALVEQVVARNPDYAPAWALLSSAHNVLPNIAGLANFSTAPLEPVVETWRNKAEPAARKAIELDPNLADGYVALGTVQSRKGKHLLAEEFYLKALTLDPNHPEALTFYSQMLSYLGYANKAVAVRQQLIAQDPFDPISDRDLGIFLWLRGEDDAALAKFKTVNNYTLIARAQAGAGRFAEAADTLLSAPQGTYRADALKEAVRILRMAPTAAAPAVALGNLEFVYVFTGDPGRALENYERLAKAGWMTSAQTQLVWHPSFAPARKLERFKPLVRKIGLVEYWRAKGWPQFCHPTTGDDFECN